MKGWRLLRKTVAVFLECLDSKIAISNSSESMPLLLLLSKFLRMSRVVTTTLLLSRCWFWVCNLALLLPCPPLTWENLFVIAFQSNEALHQGLCLLQLCNGGCSWLWCHRQVGHLGHTLTLMFQLPSILVTTSRLVVARRTCSLWYKVYFSR